MIVRMTGRTAAAAAGVAFGCAAYAYLTLPDVRPLRTANPPTTAFIELRAGDARTKGQTPRRMASGSSLRGSMLRRPITTC